VQGARSNKAGFANLATDACGLVFAIHAIVKEKQAEGKELPADLIDNLQTLLEYDNDFTLLCASHFFSSWTAS
jgi:hypothetical protein